MEVYAAYSKNENLLMKSSSGALFGVIAKLFLKNGGLVFGAAFDDNFNLKHIGISDEKELYKLLGSKYVQSKLGETYRMIRKILQNDNKKILFVGTPCQVAGLKSFLGKDYDNLFTIDIICHGVPSQKMFKQYLAWQKKKLKADITEFDFRCKTQSGWGMFGRIGLSSGKKINFKSIYDPYIGNFLQCNTYREACYECKFSCKDRVGDITLGDYWGILKEHPDFYSSKGVSCVLVNTDKGSLIWNECCSELIFTESSFDKVARHNVNLLRPSIRPERRESIYQDLNSTDFEHSMYVNVGIKTRLKNAIPYQVKQLAQKVYCLLKVGKQR